MKTFDRILLLGIFLIAITICLVFALSSKFEADNQSPCEGGRCPCPRNAGKWERSYPGHCRLENDEQAQAIRYGAVTPHDSNSVVNGQWLCQRCKRPMKGEEIFTMWGENGMPASIFCKSCNAQMPANERAKAYSLWFKDLNDSNRVIGAQAK